MIPRCRRQLITDAIPFLILFLAFVIRTLLADGFAVNPETKEIYMEPYKYFLNLMDIPLLLVLFLIGVVGVLWGIGKAVFSKTATNGIWFAGPGVVLTVLALLLCAGYNNTAYYYPSTADLQSSLTLDQQLLQRVYPTHHGIRFHSGTFRSGLYHLCLACHRPQAHYRKGTGTRRTRLLKSLNGL